jgi:hypothetical protein
MQISVVSPDDPGFLRRGIEEIEAKRLEEHVSSGLPLGSDDFVRDLEARSGRRLFPRRGGWPRNTDADGRS